MRFDDCVAELLRSAMRAAKAEDAWNETPCARTAENSLDALRDLSQNFREALALWSEETKP